jgi:phage gpG-like protein
MADSDVAIQVRTPAWLKSSGVAISQKISAANDSLMQKVAEKVRANLSGDVLKSRTGRLLNAVTAQTDDEDDVAESRISVADDVPYAGIQEYGGTTRAHVISAANAKALAFGWLGKNVFFKQIMHPGSVLPERSYLRRALDDSADEILNGYTQAVMDAFRDGTVL